jgi:hypothetical protein
VEKMRAKEKETPQRASARGRFIRSGSAGGWRGGMNLAQRQRFEKHAGDLLSRLGYALDANPVEAVTA